MLTLPTGFKRLLRPRSRRFAPWPRALAKHEAAVELFSDLEPQSAENF
jgi:hypothetical protein